MQVGACHEISKRISPYGSWKSPITSDMVASGLLSFEQIEIEDDDVYWCEMRPSDNGRYVVVKYSADEGMVDVTPSPFNARTRVHEYGGGSFKVIGNQVVFTNFADQRVYRMRLGEKPNRLTVETELRHADFEFDRVHRSLICVREDHREKGKEAENTIVSINLEAGNVKTLAWGDNFYSSPRISPDGKYLAWLSWNHPNMPWDRTALWLGKMGKDGFLDEIMQINKNAVESVLQPSWSPDNILFFVSDRNNWWNIYCWKDGEVKAVFPEEAEFGEPPWIFARSNYDFESRDKIVCSYTKNGQWSIARLNLNSEKLEEIKTPYTYISSLRATRNYGVFIGASPREAKSIVKLDLKTLETEVLKRSSEITVDSGYLSQPEGLDFPTEKTLTAHGIYYKPRNKDYAAPTGELPPLLVCVHGGPTAAVYGMLYLTVQFWTSRGFAVLDVNYGGSTGYGREYRERLLGQWGIVDVDDCVNGAKYLAERGDVDKEKLAIRGGSAGGYTAINALTFRDVFKAGASYYGICNLETFVGDTHKFESRYLESLVGPYPERRDLYWQRSAINFLHQLDGAMIIFQGLEDEIVPPNQAELIVEALRKRGKPVAYMAFEGEQHGFRQAKNIKRSLEAELFFYSKIFGFMPADYIEPVKIENSN